MSPTVLYTQAYGLGDGDPVVALPGSGKAVPRGLEAVFRFNGLTFNDTSTVDKYRVTSIDGLDDPDIRDSREDNPGVDGEMVYDSNYGGRTLAFNGKIEAFTIDKLRDMQQAIRTAFNDLSREYPLYFLTGDAARDHFINCKKFSKLQWGEEQRDENFFRDFLITLRASNPRFFSNTVTAVTIDYGAGERNKNVNNQGNYFAEPTIVINGPITEPKIYNEKTLQILAFKDTTTIADGDFFKITFNNETPTIVDQDGVNRFDELSYTSDSIKISATDINRFTTTGIGGNTGTGANTSFSISFRNAWI